MKVGDKESEKICQIMNEFDKHREKHIKVFSVELSKERETDCFKIIGSTEFFDQTKTGTRYVYFGEELYTELYKWYITKLREKKLKKLGI